MSCSTGPCQPSLVSTGSGASGSFTIPDSGDGTTIRITLTATGGAGANASISVNLQPLTSQVTLTSSPAGLQVSYEGATAAAPLTRTAVVGSKRGIAAPSPQGSNLFTAWSDGGSQQHSITVGSIDVTDAGWATDYRVSLPRDVPPGDSLTLTVNVTAPDAGGTYVLRHRMVKEMVAWFDDIQRTNVTVK